MVSETRPMVQQVRRRCVPSPPRTAQCRVTAPGNWRRIGRVQGRESGGGIAADHIEVTRLTLAKLPPGRRRTARVRAESGRGTHELLTWPAWPGPAAGLSPQEPQCAVGRSGKLRRT